MVCLGLEPEAAGWKAQTNPLSYGGTPSALFFDCSLMSLSDIWRKWVWQSREEIGDSVQGPMSWFFIFPTSFCLFSIFVSFANQWQIVASKNAEKSFSGVCLGLEPMADGQKVLQDTNLFDWEFNLFSLRSTAELCTRGKQKARLFCVSKF